VEITGGSCEHSDFLGFESPLCFVWIGRLKEKEFKEQNTWIRTADGTDRIVFPGEKKSRVLQPTMLDHCLDVSRP